MIVHQSALSWCLCEHQTHFVSSSCWMSVQIVPNMSYVMKGRLQHPKSETAICNGATCTDQWTPKLFSDKSCEMTWKQMENRHLPWRQRHRYTCAARFLRQKLPIAPTEPLARTSSIYHARPYDSSRKGSRAANDFGRGMWNYVCKTRSSFWITDGICHALSCQTNMKLQS